MCDSEGQAWATYPPEAGSVQLRLRIDVFRDQPMPGGCAITFSVPDGSDFLGKYGGAGKVLAACREAIVADLDYLISEFYDVDSTNGPSSM